ncbi:MAG: PD40 domain-containing protein [Bryobacterales bacterium]|nr:PD40 domain-containing protein [Bryobacterales bacterium]MBV9401970.1 PD40 domain-containing protein [Bryobacterales bacterium]
MRRRVFVIAAAAAVLSPYRKVKAQASFGTLAWVENGSLWIRLLPDGAPSKLASAPGLRSPRFSPSGEWIAFENAQEKRWAVRIDGKAGGELNGDAAAWLPREDHRLLHPDAVFAPDGERYVFSRDLDGPNGPSIGQLCLASLAELDREPEILVWDQNGGKKPYAWTRDGKSVIYWNADEWGASPWSDGIALSIVDVARGRSRELGITALANDDMLNLAPASAGNLLAVTSGRFRETWSEKRVTIVDLDTGGSRPLMAEEVASMCPSWSPDGKIACFAAPDANLAYNRSIAGTTERVILPNGRVEERTITPDSNISLDGYTAHPYLQQRKIWRLDPSGAAAPRQLTSDSRYRDEEPLWSADGGKILFGRMDFEGNRSLWLMDSSGGNAAQVCRLQAEDTSWFGYYGYIDWRAAFDWRP